MYNNNEFKLLKPPKRIKESFPMSQEDTDFIADSRAQACRILCGNDPRLLVIMGPCSIHNEESALAYAALVKDLQEKVKDSVFLIMRFYFEKPRTKTGWKGILYDPYLNGSNELEEGIELSRKLMTKITKMGVPIAAEIVDPIAFFYFSDLLSWICIGARTSSSQVHRQNASRMPMAVGYKNDLSGSVTNAIHSVIATDSPHTFMGINDEGNVGVLNSSGAPFAHVVLRGSKAGPNYTAEHVKPIIEELESMGLIPNIVIDCSHDNCMKKHDKMANVFDNVMDQIREGNQHIRGLMLESHIFPGSQTLSHDLSKVDPRISVTDPCIGWEETERLIEKAHHLINDITRAAT